MKKFYRFTGAASIEESISDAETQLETLERSKRMNAVARSAYQSIAWEISKKFKHIDPDNQSRFEKNLKKFAR
jgi:ABC-type Zn2+ transport system substrate-binding protein/surface adhesin